MTLKASRDDSVSDFWAIAAQIVTTLVWGYVMKPGNTDLDQLAEDIREGLREISNELGKIEAKLDIIITLLLQLPQVVQGIVQKELIENSLNYATGILQNIQPLIIDEETFRKNAREAQRLCHELWKEMYNVAQRSDYQNKGAATVLLTLAPHFSVFAKAYTYANKFIATETGVKKSPTVWDHPANEYLINMLDCFFAALDKIEADYDRVKDIPMPNDRYGNYRRIYKFQDNPPRIIPTPIVVPECIGENPNEEFRYGCWGDLLEHSPGEVYSTNLFILPPEYLPVGPWCFRFPTKFSDGEIPEVRGAINYLASIATSFRYWKKTQQIVGNIDDLKDQYQIIRHKPATW